MGGKTWRYVSVTIIAENKYSPSSFLPLSFSLFFFFSPPILTFSPLPPTYLYLSLPLLCFILGDKVIKPKIPSHPLYIAPLGSKAPQCFVYHPTPQFWHRYIYQATGTLNVIYFQQLLLHLHTYKFCPRVPCGGAPVVYLPWLSSWLWSVLGKQFVT